MRLFRAELCRIAAFLTCNGYNSCRLKTVSGLYWLIAIGANCASALGPPAQCCSVAFADCARSLTPGRSALFAALVHIAFFASSCFLSLIVVVAAYKARPECNAVVPEFIVAPIMNGYVVFSVAPLTVWP